MRSLISAIRAREDVWDFLLCGPADFDLDAADHVEEVRLASGVSLEGFAGDGGGGTYFFCGEGGEERPVLYADSEGGAALLAIGLRELLDVLFVVPWWGDCPGLTVEESRQAADSYLADEPELFADRAAAAAALGLALPEEAVVLARLRELAVGPGRDHVLLNAVEGTAYSALIAERP
ncbi:hypothetical protein ACFZB9_34515 [Kitasatospora sp. NPDC008050]|uniref:hypothetical protein n=1 Tax=Kitasatospora sp. NPDC008050 TaxID=3364021 RepID=UPI0036EA7037